MPTSSLCSGKLIFKHIFRPHPFTKIDEKGCGLISFSEYMKIPETLKVRGEAKLPPYGGSEIIS